MKLNIRSEQSFLSFDLENVITEPTRITQTKTASIDPIIISDSMPCTSIQIDIQSDISEYRATCAHLKY